MEEPQQAEVKKTIQRSMFLFVSVSFTGLMKSNILAYATVSSIWALVAPAGEVGR